MAKTKDTPTTPVSSVRSFVEGTQRGYASGLRRVRPDGKDGGTLIEYHHRDGGTSAGMDKAYAEASRSASTLLQTWQRQPDLIRRRQGFTGR